MRITMVEAETRFAELLQRAEAGEEVELTRHGRTEVRVFPAAQMPLIGALKQRIEMGSDFDELPEDFVEALAAPIEPQG